MIRVTPSAAYASFTRNIARLSAEMANLNNQIGTGKRIQVPSDDPASAAQAVRLSSDMARLDQLDRTRGQAENRLQSTESALASVSDILTQVRTLALQGASTQGTQSREAIAQGLEGLFHDMVTAANTDDPTAGYLFSGYATQTAPFTVSGSFSATVPPASTIAATYGGTSDTTQAEIGPNDQVTVGWPGNQIFQGNGDPNQDVFQTIVKIRDAVLAGDTDTVNAQLGNLNDALDQISGSRGVLGTELKRAQDADQALSQQKSNLQIQLDNAQGVDLVSAIADLQQTQTAYQAALSAGSQTLGKSLLDYIS